MQLLLILVVAIVAVAAQMTYDCPDGNCLFPEGCNKNFTMNGVGINVSKSPFYDQVVTGGYDHNNTDCACVTFFDLGNGVYIMCRFVTYTNGKTELHRYIYLTIQGTNGAFRGQGIRNTTGCDTCLINDYVLGEPCPDSYVIYRCYFYGNCHEEYAGRDNRFGFSSMENVSKECKDQMVHLGTVGNPGLQGQDPLYLPNKLTKSCLVSMNNSTCINFERVPCAYRVYL